MRKELFVAVLLAFAFSRSVEAAGEACAQAHDIVADVAAQYAGGSPNHAALLGRLKTARTLCSTLGDAWKYSYCSAQALGQQREAQIFRDRAVFAGVSDFSCPIGEEGAPVAAKTPLPSYVRAKYALVIGIGRFKDPDIPRLQFAAKDARDLASVLTDPTYGRFDPANVTLLTDETATRANILNALQDLILNSQDDDLVFLYVSSHGSPHRAESGLGGVGYIVTYDSAVRNIWLDSLDYEQFYRQVSLLKARRKAVFLDTCYSGQFRKGEKSLSIEGGVDVNDAKRFLSGEGTYVITSSRADERSWESEELQNSYFTHFLIAALRQGAEPPTLKEIFAGLGRDVAAAVSREKGMPQHPQVVPADGPGDLRIGVTPLTAGSPTSKGGTQ